ncbi:MAG: hypothetical protein AB8B99_02930 [Phormidesmis sp.]
MKKATIGWISTTKTAKKLGVKPKFLRENRLKLFKAGRHYRPKNPHAYRPTYVWHYERCEQLLNKAAKDAAKIEVSQTSVAVAKGTQLPFLKCVEPYEIP